MSKLHLSAAAHSNDHTAIQKFALMCLVGNDKMYILNQIPVPEFWGQYLTDPDTNINTCMDVIFCILAVVTAANELEFCKILKSELSQDRRCNDGHLTINELCTRSDHSSYI